METNNILNNNQPLNGVEPSSTRQARLNTKLKQRLEHRKKPPDCNFFSCKRCNINWKPRSTQDQARFKQVRDQRPPRRKHKFCNLDCEVCNRKLEKLEQLDQWNQMQHQEQPPKPQEERFKSNNPKEIANELNFSDFTQQETIKDEDSLWRSILILGNKDQHLYDEFKLQLPEIVEHWSNTNERERTKLVMEQIQNKAPPTTDLIKAIADYTQTNIVILTGGVKREIQSTPESENYLFLAHFEDSNQQDKDIFQPLKPNIDLPLFSLQKLEQRLEQLLNIEQARQIEETDFRFIVWNCRKMRTQVKANILNDIAIAREIDFVLLQETHLSSEEYFKMRDYKIYRSDSEAHTKGVAILINRRIDAKILIMQRDMEGRAIKIRAEDPNTGAFHTITNLYHEPSADPDIINPIFFSSEIVAGDCNDHPTGLETYHKYHYKGLQLQDEFHCPLAFSDHRMLIMNCKMKLKRKDISTVIVKIDREVAQSNLEMLTEFNPNTSNGTSLTNPRISRSVEKPTIMHLDLSTDYVQMENERIREIKENTATKQQQIALLLNRTNLTREDWQTLNNNLNLKKRAGIYTKDNDFETILNGIKTHFRHDNSEPSRINTDQEIHNLLEKAVNLANTIDDDKLYIPRSTARDHNGFSQREIVQCWQIERAKDILGKITQLWTSRNMILGAEYFFHNTTNIILFKKTAEASTWDKLRPIAIFPAWLMVLEKILSKKVNKEVKQIISPHQFGFTESRDTVMAKLKAAQSATDNNFNYTLLLDLSKAYDCVNIDKLSNIIQTSSLEENSKGYLLNLLKFYQKVKLNISEHQVQPKRGLPQGAPSSPTLFNIYVDSILRETNIEFQNRARIAAYADDIIIQTDEIGTAAEVAIAVSTKLEQLELKLNVSKTVLISETENNYIVLNQQTITSTRFDRYLGQIIDFAGKAATTINTKDYAKLLNIMQNNRNLSRIALVRLFQIYLRSKFNHLTPLIIQSDKLAETWKALKKILFKHTLGYSTMPLEARNLIKIGYYDIIIKPLLKLERRTSQNNDERLLAFIHIGVKKAMAYWIQAEPNISEEIQEMILNVTQNENIVLQDVNQWDKQVRIMAINRLLNYTYSLNAIADIERLMYPNIILASSNAFIHTIEDAIVGYWKKPNTKNNKEKIIQKTLLKMLTIYEISTGDYTMDVELIDPQGLYATAEQYALMEANIKKMTRNVIRTKEQESKELTHTTLSSNQRPINQTDFKREKTRIENLKELQNQIATNMLAKPKEILKPAEISIEYLLRGMTTTKTTNQRQITDYTN